MDHVGPFPRSRTGNNHVIALQDNFTKFLLMGAVPSVKAKPTCEFLKDVVSIFGCPKTLITDRGTAFTAEEFERICKENMIQHVKNATATPRANGQIERSNATIATAITTSYDKDNGADWDEKLRDIQFSLNTMQNKTTKLSPQELMFNYNPRNALRNQLVVALQDLAEEDEQRKEQTEIVEGEQAPGGIAGDGASNGGEQKRTVALERIKESQEKQKNRYDSQHKPPRKYAVGDLVLIRREFAAMGQTRKLAPKYKGPYQVAEVLQHDRYRLRDVPGAERTQRTFESVFSSDRMKLWCRPEEEEMDSNTDEENESTAADPERRIRTRSQTAAQQDRRRSRCQEGPNVNQENKT